MNKTIKIAIGATLTLGVFGAGLFSKDIVSKAGSSWSATAENEAYGELLDVANSTKNGLVQDINSDVNDKINGAIKSSVDEQQAELEKSLEQYYQMKIDGLTETPEFLALEQKIKDIQKSVLESFKTQIDQEFANQTQGQ